MMNQNEAPLSGLKFLRGMETEGEERFLVNFMDFRFVRILGQTS